MNAYVGQRRLSETPTGEQWYAVYTRARHEKAVHRRLLSKKIEAFLPLHDVLSRWKDRRKWVRKPLFPGYLFVHVRRCHLGEICRQRGVVHAVGDGRNPVSVPPSQISGVRRMATGPAPVRPSRYVRKGQKVRVLDGPLTGIEGRIVTRKNRHRLVVNIDLLNRSVATEIDLENVQFLEPHAAPASSVSVLD